VRCWPGLQIEESAASVSQNVIWVNFEVNRLACHPVTVIWMLVPTSLTSPSKQAHQSPVYQDFSLISFPGKLIASYPGFVNEIAVCAADCDSVSCDDLVIGIGDEQVTGCGIVVKIGTDDCDVRILIRGPGHDRGCDFDSDAHVLSVDPSLPDLPVVAAELILLQHHLSEKLPQ
jgi:hypothetical protein